MERLVGVVMDTAQSEYKRYANLKENMNGLRKRIEQLKFREEEVEIEVNVGQVQSGKKRKRGVETWQTCVQRIKEETQNIEDEFQRRRTRQETRELGKLVVKKIEEVDQLLEKGSFSDGLFAPLLLDCGATLPTTPLVGKKKTLDEIWDCLTDDEIQKIGVYGMGGIGKTTIMKHINNSLKEARCFSIVIWVTVSNDSNVERLQNSIAERIQLDLSKCRSKDSRYMTLFEALGRMTKFVLILDDVWKPISLQEIGIPEPNKENSCKVVLTTRSLDVCRCMETQRDIKVEVLSKDEAWGLFKEKIGIDLVLSDDIECIAKQVVNECGCLPLAIITVGRALRKVSSIRDWRYALRKLRDSANEFKHMPDDVFAHLMFSYDRLRNDKIQACFLYCALYPEDDLINVEELIDIWIWEGLIEDEGDRQMKFDEGETIINELIDASMLEKTDQCVKMHDLIRDMAINITKTNPQFLVRAGIGLEESPKDEEWTENIQRISLMRNRIRQLLGHPKCPKLFTLLMQENRDLMSISPSFLEHTHHLRVLNLSNTKIDVLPESVCNLENLHALILRECICLKKLPSVAKLKKLRLLDLYGSSIEELPHGMEMLINLKCLDLMYTSHLQMQIFPSGVMTRLEELYMCGSQYRWREMGDGNRIEDITKSTQLAYLTLSFADVHTCSNYVKSGHWRVLKVFHFTIGEGSGNMQYNRFRLSDAQVCFSNCDFSSQESSLVLPTNIRKLKIVDSYNLTRFSDLSCLSNLTEFKKCEIEGVEGMESFLASGADTLHRLEYLYIDNVSLRCLCEGVIAGGTLSSLHTLIIIGCHRIEKLFSFGMLQHLPNLESLTVGHCEVVEVIEADEVEMGEEGSNNNCTITLPKLKTLTLCLPKLKSICAGMLICNSVSNVFIWGCCELKKFPLSLQHLQNLEDLYVNSCGMVEVMEADEVEMGEEGSNNNCTVTLPKLETLRLMNLPKLKSICAGMLICNSVRSVSICGCFELKKFPLSLDLDSSSTSAASLVEFYTDKEWWDAVEWNDPNTKTLLRPLLRPHLS